MNAKWCVSTLLIFLALLGLSQQHKKASNQQIFLEFTNVEIASENMREEALSTITKKLLSLGVKAIEIIENDGNQINIRYYSDIDANDVKKFLLNESLLSWTEDPQIPSEFPKEEIPEKYCLVVYDLQQQSPKTLDLNGNLVLTQEDDQIGMAGPGPVILHYDYPLVLRPRDYDKIALKAYEDIAFAIDNISQEIPEVRAGPYLV